MQTRSILSSVFLGLMCLSVVVLAWGCSGKRVASSSGDASSTTKEKSAPATAAAPVETIKPEGMVTVPEERRSTTETARAPLAAPSAQSEGPGSSLSGDMSAVADIFFDFDRYAIRRDAQPVLEGNAIWMKKTPGKSVLIEGHCDERGTQAYNLVLGEKRARSTKHYLEDLGIPASRLKIVSYGEMRPFCKERDEDCYQKNRRAHFVVQ
ncbi:MAG TPA: peptidoglycan-associated lipoprotein Pal [Nitrospira sp.]|nr:peptidoglycan-associated lipoprotein Pal [Nitrospira sp.]